MCEKSKKISVVLVVLFSCFVSSAFGQPVYYSKQDTIRLKMPNGTTIEYTAYYQRDKLYKPFCVKLKDYEKELKQSLGDFLKRWEVLGIANLEERKPLFIVGLADKIQITEREENKTVLFPKNAKVALFINGKHKLKLLQTYSNVFIYFDNIQQLKELKDYNYQKIFANSDKQLASVSADHKNKRKRLQAWLSVDKDDAVNLTYQEFERKKREGNYLDLGFSPNIENINGSWLSGIEPRIDFLLNNKWRLGFGYEFKYNFSDRDTTNISHWGNFRAMVKGGLVSNDWVGISVGFLFKERGDFFDNHKFRFGFPVSYDNFTVTPEFYTKGFFKKAEKDNAYFGVKISFGL